jgi:tRNA(Ile)-lysidine synthase
MAQSLLDRLRAHLRETRLLEGPACAVLAVSGGADSLALLDLVASLASELRLQLLVAHADHGILEESSRVAAQVRDIARRRYGLDCVTGELRLGPRAGETRARAARYRFLRAVQAEHGARYLLTAHHADDQIETVLLRLLRGSAPAGLAGIAPRGPNGLVRPLLSFVRSELSAHAESLGVPITCDPSNADPRHFRAWVRHILLPVITERLGHQARSALLGVSAHAAHEVEAWDAALEALPGLLIRVEPGRAEVARVVLSGYDNALAGRVLRAAARRAGLVLGPRAAELAAAFAARAASGRRLILGERLRAEAAFDHLVLCGERSTPGPSVLEGGEGGLRFGRYRIRWRSELAPEALERGGWTTWVRPGSLLVRSPRPGDRLVPLGGTGHRRVARLLMEARVPRADRPVYPLVERDGAVVWVPGVCRAGDELPGAGEPAVRIDVGHR